MRAEAIQKILHGLAMSHHLAEVVMWGGKVTVDILLDLHHVLAMAF